MSGSRRVRQARTEELTAHEIDEIRTLLWAAFHHDVEDERFTEDDWQHALGGVHFIGTDAGRVVSHAAVVERELRAAEQPLRTGYVEAVATVPAEQRRGHGTAVMREVNTHIADAYELGALGTGSQSFYERLGWQVWRGSSSVRGPAGNVATPDDDGYILVLLTPSTPPLDLDLPISCDWREGDVW